MAQEIVYKDDLNGDMGAEPVRFGLDGTDFEIDLGDANASRLRDFLAEFIAAAREVEKKAPTSSATRARGKRGGAYGYNPATVREWWKANESEAGRPFKQKGIVPLAIVERWEAAGRPGDPAKEAGPQD